LIQRTTAQSSFDQSEPLILSTPLFRTGASIETLLWIGKNRAPIEVFVVFAKKTSSRCGLDGPLAGDALLPLRKFPSVV